MERRVVVRSQVSYLGTVSVSYLSANAIWWWPWQIVFLHYFRINNYAFQLLHDRLMHKCFFADHCVVFIVGIVSIAQLSIWTELKLEELVSKLALVADIVTQIEVLRRHCCFSVQIPIKMVYYRQK